MKCLYPDVKPVTAYNKGCRCGRCREGKREVNRKSRGVPWEQRSPGMKSRYPVPAKPIIKLIENWIRQNKESTTNVFKGLAQELGVRESAAERMVYRLRNESAYISFSQADKIISSLFGPHYWFTDEDLLAIYEEHA